MNVPLLRDIYWSGKQTEAYVIACRVLELLQVLGKTNSVAKTVTLPMTLNQLLWKMNLWARSVPITACELTNAMTLNIFTFHLLKQETNQ